MRLIDLCGESTAVLFGGVGTRDSGVGIRRGEREQRGDKIGSHALAHLVRSRGAAAKPRNRAREGTLSFFCWCPSASELAMGINKKTIATVVTTVSRLGGEDKIIRNIFTS